MRIVWRDCPIKKANQDCCSQQSHIMNIGYTITVILIILYQRFAHKRLLNCVAWLWKTLHKLQKHIGVRDCMRPMSHSNIDSHY